MKLAITLIVLLLAQDAGAVRADDDRYRPHVSGKPAGVLVGTLAGYGQGMASGALDIRTRDGLVALYTAAPPFAIDGKPVACPQPPRPPAYRRDPQLCFRWPSYVKVGVSRVRVPFWRGTRYGQPTLVARGLTVLK